MILSALYIAIGRQIYIATCTDVGVDAAGSGRLMRKSIVSALTGVTKEKDVAQLKRMSSYYLDFGSKIQSSNVDAIEDTNGKTNSLPKRKTIFDHVPEKMEDMYQRSGSQLEISSLMTKHTTARHYGQSELNSNNPRTKMSRPLVRKSFSTLKTRATRKNTMMMRMVTIAFMLSYTPFLIILIIRYTHDSDLYKYYLSLGFSERVAYKIFLNSYFINSMINPYIYGFMNAQFRKQVKDLFRKIFCSSCIYKRNERCNAESASFI
ncbi:hypothetical protein DPMN_102565 [Dreissena polymorpha]|uniref:G-protein coupled receptors family 1 profile domain-containing protein n=1 Tax=Dreissena polymorpha TaxID=45954 RepID=A0A9D4RAN0_DREPO|nr:hypothetical protein DPMN_102565 [Dreissena polymorpha]